MNDIINKTMPARQYSDEEILDYAKDVVLEDLVNFAFPMFPTDEYGIPDYSDGPGCVPWCSVSECEATEAIIEERKEGEVLVIVILNIKWSYENKDDEEEDDDAMFQVTVFTDYSTLQHEEIVRCD